MSWDVLGHPGIFYLYCEHPAFTSSRFSISIFLSHHYLNSMTRQQTQISGKTVYTTPDGQILCNCPGDVTGEFSFCRGYISPRNLTTKFYQHSIITLGQMPKMLDEDFGVVPNGRPVLTVVSLVFILSTHLIHITKLQIFSLVWVQSYIPTGCSKCDVSASHSKNPTHCTDQ